MKKLLKKLLIVCLLSLYIGQISAADIELYPVYGKFYSIKDSTRDGLLITKLQLKFTNDGYVLYEPNLKIMADQYLLRESILATTNNNYADQLNNIDSSYNKVKEVLEAMDLAKHITSYLEAGISLNPVAMTKAITDTFLKTNLAKQLGWNSNNVVMSIIKDVVYTASDVLINEYLKKSSVASGLTQAVIDEITVNAIEKYIAIPLAIYDGVIKSANLLNALNAISKVNQINKQQAQNYVKSKFVTEYIQNYQSDIQLMVKAYNVIDNSGKTLVIDDTTFATFFVRFAQKSMGNKYDPLWFDGLERLKAEDFYKFLMQNGRFSPARINGNYNYYKSGSNKHVFMSYSPNLKSCSISNWNGLINQNAIGTVFASNSASYYFNINQKTTIPLNCDSITGLAVSKIAIPSKPGDPEIYKNQTLWQAYKSLVATKAIDTTNVKFYPSSPVSAYATVKFAYAHLPISMKAKSWMYKSNKTIPLLTTKWEECQKDGLCSNGVKNELSNIFTLPDSTVTRDQLAQFICTYTKEIVQKPLCKFHAFDKIGTNNKSRLPLNIMKYQGNTRVTRGEAIIIINRVKNALK